MQNSDAHAALTRRVTLSKVGHKAAKVWGLDYPATCKLIEELQAGTVVVDAEALGREVEKFLGTVRCHSSCKPWVRQYGYAPYKSTDPSYHLDEHLCEVCSLPLECRNPNGEHSYVELSLAECRKRRIFHGGNCYHVSECSGCGHVRSVDSSD